jgi:hypothetical protein
MNMNIMLMVSIWICIVLNAWSIFVKSTCEETVEGFGRRGNPIYSKIQSMSRKIDDLHNVRDKIIHLHEMVLLFIRNPNAYNDNIDLPYLYRKVGWRIPT